MKIVGIPAAQARWKEPGNKDIPLKGLWPDLLAHRQQPWAPQRDSGPGGARGIQGKIELKVASWQGLE